MRNYLLIFFILALGCSHSKKKETENLPKFVNLKSSFKEFVKKAKKLDFEAQINLWKSEVEQSVPDVYREIFGDTKGGTNKVTRKLAKKWFPFLLKNSDKIVIQFENFEKQSWPIIKELAKKYEKIDFSEVRVIALPSLMMFDGMVTKVDGKFVAVFGMDFFEMARVNPKVIKGANLVNNSPVILAHEFTHILHAKKSDFSGTGSISSLFEPLWREGLAQIHSQALIPGTDLKNIFMEKNITAKCSSSNVKLWAKQFIEDSKISNEKKLWNLYGKWFFTTKGDALGVSKAGYCLGYNLILRALRNHSIDELMKMSKSDSYTLMKKELLEMQ